MGFRITFLLKCMKIPQSNYYRWLKPKKHSNAKRGRKERGFSFFSYGGIFSDSKLESLLKFLYSQDDPLKEEFYIKFLGVKKLSSYLKKIYGIVVNHKKLVKILDRLGFSNKYTKRLNKCIKRSRARTINKPNQLWEADITYVRTIENGNIAILNIIDVFDRSIIGTYIGKQCKRNHFEAIMKRAIEKREKPEVLRTDNGSIFKSFETGMYLYDEDIVQEFGYNHNPDSQAHIESSFSSLKREFAKNNVFLNLDDVCSKLKVYLSFYNNLRPHGSLNYESPNDFYDICSNSQYTYVRA